ncbi:hypothetical protein [Actinomadura flavalba]|uniref:hypothetical protein n=1 Tax=Actinomadura flavalba TaxID=1120938 RepID=UPI00036DF5D5|nr:hypothetical protein [Actinomadura flavalba]
MNDRTAVRIDPETLGYVYPVGHDRQFFPAEINTLNLRCPRCQAPASVASVPVENLAQMHAEVFQLGRWRRSKICKPS